MSASTIVVAGLGGVLAVGTFAYAYMTNGFAPGVVDAKDKPPRPEGDDGTGDDGTGDDGTADDGTGDDGTGDDDVQHSAEREAQEREKKKVDALIKQYTSYASTSNTNIGDFNNKVIDMMKLVEKAKDEVLDALRPIALSTSDPDFSDYDKFNSLYKQLLTAVDLSNESIIDIDKSGTEATGYSSELAGKLSREKLAAKIMVTVAPLLQTNDKLLKEAEDNNTKAKEICQQFLTEVKDLDVKAFGPLNAAIKAAVANLGATADRNQVLAGIKAGEKRLKFCDDLPKKPVEDALHTLNNWLAANPEAPSDLAADSGPGGEALDLEPPPEGAAGIEVALMDDVAAPAEAVPPVDGAEPADEVGATAAEGGETRDAAAAEAEGVGPGGGESDVEDGEVRAADGGPASAIVAHARASAAEGSADKSVSPITTITRELDISIRDDEMDALVLDTSSGIPPGFSFKPKEDDEQYFYTSYEYIHSFKAQVGGYDNCFSKYSECPPMSHLAYCKTPNVLLVACANEIGMLKIEDVDLLSKERSKVLGPKMLVNLGDLCTILTSCGDSIIACTSTQARFYKVITSSSDDDTTLLAIGEPLDCAKIWKIEWNKTGESAWALTSMGTIVELKPGAIDPVTTVVDSATSLSVNYKGQMVYTYLDTVFLLKICEMDVIENLLNVKEHFINSNRDGTTINDITDDDIKNGRICDVHFITNDVIDVTILLQEYIITFMFNITTRAQVENGEYTYFGDQSLYPFLIDPEKKSAPQQTLITRLQNSMYQKLYSNCLGDIDRCYRIIDEQTVITYRTENDGLTVEELKRPSLHTCNIYPGEELIWITGLCSRDHYIYALNSDGTLLATVFQHHPKKEI